MTAIFQVPMPDSTTIDGLARMALAHYDACYQGNIRLISLSENATYAVRTPTGERFVLRLHRPNYHSPAAVRSELAWLAALQQAGFEVPQAIPDKNGDLLQQVDLPDRIPHMAVLFHWIAGQEPNPCENLQASFERLGAINARLHQQARHWYLPSGFERFTWDHETMLGIAARWGNWRQTPRLSSSDLKLIEETVSVIRNQLEDYGKSRERFGLIHADLRFANLLVDGERTRIIDFDDCGFGWYLHDLASALSFHEHQAEALIWGRHWLRGYSHVASLAQADVDMIPALLVQRRLQLLAWTGTHAETRLARSLGPSWVSQTLPLCRTYLDGQLHFG